LRRTLPACRAGDQRDFACEIDHSTSPPRKYAEILRRMRRTRLAAVSMSEIGAWFGCDGFTDSGSAG
ncbi:MULTISPECIES: hypothetical protein, partial [unclassified Nocardia]|uniref:hypothetical protein n=1 Tax=unclassified Nocardia TaxID=2637762 RepID=UPI001E29E601